MSRPPSRRWSRAIPDSLRPDGTPDDRRLSRRRSGDDADLARALGALMNLSPAAGARRAPTRLPARRRPPTAHLPPPVPTDTGFWADEPVAPKGSADAGFWAEEPLPAADDGSAAAIPWLPDDAEPGSRSDEPATTTAAGATTAGATTGTTTTATGAATTATGATTAGATTAAGELRPSPPAPTEDAAWAAAVGLSTSPVTPPDDHAAPAPGWPSGAPDDHATWAPAGAGVVEPHADRDAEVEAASAAALADAGFGGPLHDALGQLRRISDDPAADVTAAAGAVPPPRRPGLGERLGRPGEWRGVAAAWWSERWRDVLPGLVVAALVVMAFTVVLATGGRHSSNSHLDTSGPGTTDTTAVPPATVAILPPDLTGAGNDASAASVPDASGAAVGSQGGGTTANTRAPARGTTNSAPVTRGSTPTPGGGTVATTVPASVTKTTTPHTTTSVSTVTSTTTELSTTTTVVTTQDPCAGLSGDLLTRCQNHLPSSG
ncbi:MAG: hypothetical protein ABR511_05905 [Acidimicrobiales bacterium]